MASHRRRNFVTSRRRVDDEGEDEDGFGDAGDDSQSDASALTDPGENLDADDSDLSDGENNEVSPVVASKSAVNGSRKGPRKRNDYDKKLTFAKEERSVSEADSTLFQSTADTEAMMNGLKIAGHNDNHEEAIDFDGVAETPQSADTESPTEISAKRAAASKRETFRERRLREHEEYKTKRDSDPAFVPNRGGFFMHDQRDGPGRANGFAGFGRGRGRGRPGHFDDAGSSRPVAPSDESNKDRWDHDLHESVADGNTGEQPSMPQRGQHRPEQQAPPNTSQPVSLSKTLSIGTISLRAFLPGMEKPHLFEKTPVRQHTRLPDLRPPLRRDKAVRVSLPDHAPQYIFPSAERSFIFIPRAQRPNQGSRHRGRGYLSQPASRRTSVHGGSVYTPSVAMSRRSSQARDGIGSPVGSMMSRAPPVIPAPARPVVRLPAPGSMYPPQMPNHMPISGDGTPIMGMPPPQPNVMPSLPQFQQSRPNQIPMHQPRPQKAVSVASIESPSSQLQAAQQQQDDQAFHHQISMQMNGRGSAVDSSLMMPHTRQSSYQGQPTLGTPLSNIPEGAINAQPFQPGVIPQQTFYPPAYSVGPMYYYQQPQQDQFAGPMYMQQEPYFMPMMYAPAPRPDAATVSGQPGTFAHESNGMVYYYNPSHVMNSGEGTAPINYSGDAGPMMPTGAEGFYYPQTPQGLVYYPPQ